METNEQRKMTFGERLREARKSAGLTQEQLAQSLLVSRQAITNKEFYLVTKGEKQYLVMVTDEFIESRQLREKITAKKFEIGNFAFTDCGAIEKT